MLGKEVVGKAFMRRVAFGLPFLGSWCGMSFSRMYQTSSAPDSRYAVRMTYITEAIWWIFPFPINLLIELLSFPDRTLGSRHWQLLRSPKDPHRTTPGQDQRRYGRRDTHHNMGIAHRNILSRSQLGEAFTVRPPSCCQMHRRAVPCSNLQTLGARLPELV